MGNKFRNRYRIESNRMPGWNYAGSGSYFITLVTQYRDCCLGKVIYENGIYTVDLSDFGKIVDLEWIKSFSMRNELVLDKYIIMPNHLHAIIILNKPDEQNSEESKKNHKTEPACESGKNNPPFMREPKSISSFIGGFKSSVNSEIDDYIDEHHLDIPKYNKKNHFFQSNFHDHVIRNLDEYYRIKQYIINNPAKWNSDHFNPENTK